MECRSCGSKWEQSKGSSRTFTACPFCGASLGEADDNKEKICDNSKDALAYIMRTHGADVLLCSTLKSYLLDYVPTIEKRRRNVISSVSGSGAADLLKKGMTAGAEEQKRIYKQAVQRVVDDYGTDRSLVESVMLEFTEALGWKVRDPAKEEAEKKGSEQEERKRKQEEERKRREAKNQNREQEEERKRRKAQEQKRKQIRIERLEQIERWREAKVQKRTKEEERKKQEEDQKRKQSAGSLQVGQRNVQFGPYKWRVLDVQNGRALLLAEKVLEKRTYHSYHSSGHIIYGHLTWEKCNLQKYLNGEFLQRFNASEQSRIAEVVNANPDNPWYGTPGGNATKDKVFLLSIDEVVRYFGDSGALKSQNGMRRYGINDQYNIARRAEYGDEGVEWWWLRSPGSHAFEATRVGCNGDIDISGFLVVDNENGGVRPALWLNL